ncbi:hypothetical protein CYANOKiyG1_37030 [Okeania sp. KiyG1]|nr:hypothetical protein CYANOKiyG1_37030 [Okeania sp. KiyG1]
MVEVLNLRSSAFTWKNGQVYLAKCAEALPIRWSRQLPPGCVPSTITVKLDPSGRWSVCLRFNDNRDFQLKPLKKRVGVDVGISSLIATSDGTKVNNPKYFNKLYKKLRLSQKSLSRKTKGSNNYQKARLKVARIHAKIKDSRLDYTHKLTTQLIRENQTIVVEDLAVKNMVKNHKLARAISDANWGELVRQLEYKAEWYGRELIKIDRYFPSSKRCSECGYVVDKLPLDIREWDCPECAAHHDRDLNASINILAAGLAVSVCGATVRPEGSKSRRAGAMKQKAPSSDVKESRAVTQVQRREDVKQRTPRGRVVTSAAWRHLGFAPPDEQLSLKL